MGKVGLQIKCLLELNCVCVLFLLTQHVRSSLLGPGGGRYQNTYAVKGCYNGPDANSCGSETKRERESPLELLFMMDAT